ncbi:hypothetical protein PHLGIDRAFT_432214 [Phlebiopsis gigantea 11061_1 CR5-6]|uniref:F-box domain-containing protein n=1 Tax=Phlebiopsis gigantea (strain 11061_1 CR5-6) TaxID=745531 RepID=A0A0C3RYB6_PHLG1|nr:hypothetical protein PHLGIDRAFT_432214 [Phlebiopsis gigantea 11061_1 CR5-6]
MDPVPCQKVVYLDRLKTRFNLEMNDIVHEKDLLEMVFQNISRFPNLRSFSAQQVSLTGAHFDSLSGLKYLTEMHLERCQCTGELGLARFQLKFLSLHGKMTGTHGWWIPILKSPSIQQLSYDAVCGPVEDPELFLPVLSTGPHMQFLRTLRIPSFAVFFPCFALALSRCPLLENLHLVIPDLSAPTTLLPTPDSYPLLSPGSLSNLRAISAPFGFLEHCILKRDSGVRLTHITISDMLRYPDGILGLVKDTCPDLEELGLSMHQFPLDSYPHTFWLQAIFNAFPKLRGLHIAYDSMRFPYEHLQKFLKAVTYPATLRSLYIVAFYAQGVSEPSPVPRRMPELVQHIKDYASSIAEIEITLDKSISWKDMYIRCSKWYKWDPYGSRTPLL